MVVLVSMYSYMVEVEQEVVVEVTEVPAAMEMYAGVKAVIEAMYMTGMSRPVM